MFSDIIGLDVKYYDFLGQMQFGKIVYAEPFPQDKDLAYVYIEDENPDFNVHRIDTLDGTITYADIRISDEVYIDK